MPLDHMIIDKLFTYLSTIFLLSVKRSAKHYHLIFHEELRTANPWPNKPYTQTKIGNYDYAIKSTICLYAYVASDLPHEHYVS